MKISSPPATLRLLSPFIFLISLLFANAATITWDGGGGDANWHNPLNWSGDQVPGSGDDVVIEGNVTAEVRASVSTQGFRLTGGATLRVRGSGTAFTANGTTAVEDADLHVIESAAVSLPNLTRLADNPDTCCGRNILAEDPGSVLDLSGVTFLDGGQALRIYARNGGKLLLNGVEEKTLGQVELHAVGTGSVLEAKELRNFAGGQFFVVGGALLDVPKLGSLSDCDIHVQGGAVFRPPSLTRLADDAQTCCGRNILAEDPGSVLDLSGVTFLDGGQALNFRATGAGRVLLPLVPLVSGTTRFLADGEGSLVDLSSLHSLVPDNGSSIVARNQGVVALPADFNATGIEFSGVTPGITFPVAPQITQQPLDRTVPLGSTATFTLVAAGNQPITYRWQIEATQNNWQNISGQNTATLTIANVHFGKEGRYRCILVNVGGLVISRAAQLLVGEEPPPDSDGDGLLDAWERQYFPDLSQGAAGDPDGDGLTNAQEQTATTNPTQADTDGDGLRDGWEVAHALNPLVNDAAGDGDGDGLTNLQEQAAGTDPRQADTDGDTFSDGIEVAAGSNPLDPNSRPATAPQITAQPQSRTVVEGGSVTFSVTATGTPPLAYQWRKGDQPIATATGSSLTLNPVQTTDAGSYSVVVSNAGGSVPSNPAVLTVTPVTVDCPPAHLTSVLVPGLWVEGQVGCRFRIKFTASLSEPVWQALDTLTLSQPKELWVDPQGIGQPMRYYRAVPQEGGGTVVVPWRGFERITDQAVPVSTSLNSFGSFGDFDGDGDPDLLIAHHDNFARKSLSGVYRNDSGVFTSVGAGDLAATENGGGGGAWADYDNDGDLDVVMANTYGPDQLFRNNGNTTFTLVIGALGTASVYSTGAAWADYDRDGWVDLFVSRASPAGLFAPFCALYHGNGDGSFTEVGGPFSTEAGQWYGCGWADYDGDGDPDIAVAAHGGDIVIYRNEGAGSFTRRPTAETGLGSGSWSSLAWGDYDNDGDPDLYSAAVGNGSRLWRNDGGQFADVTAGSLGVSNGTASAWADVDNDGDLDLLAVNGPEYFHLNNGNGTFTRREAVPPADVSGEGVVNVAFADFNGDGWTDVFLGPGQAQATRRLYHNLGGSNRWLKLRLQGTASNRSAIGAKVTVTAGGRAQTRMIESGNSYMSQANLTPAFGLGEATQAAEVRVNWPSGKTTVLSGVAANQTLTITE